MLAGLIDLRCVIVLCLSGFFNLFSRKSNVIKLL